MPKENKAMTASEQEIVQRIVDGFCTACLADLKPSDQIVECANCEAQLHLACADCPCEKVKKANQRS